MSSCQSRRNMWSVLILWDRIDNSQTTRSVSLWTQLTGILRSGKRMSRRVYKRIEIWDWNTLLTILKLTKRPRPKLLPRLLQKLKSSNGRRMPKIPYTLERTSQRKTVFQTRSWPTLRPTTSTWLWLQGDFPIIKTGWKWLMISFSIMSWSTLRSSKLCSSILDLQMSHAASQIQIV